MQLTASYSSQHTIILAKNPSELSHGRHVEF